MRAALLIGLVLPLAAACGSWVRAAADTERRPDVLLIVIDTLRADHLSAYGYERPTSPVLEQLAAEGSLCEDVTAQCSWTLPSMVSMLQGCYTTTYRDVYLEDLPTLSEVFQDAGYRTLGVVGNGLLSAERGFDRGFDHYDARKAGRRKDGRRSSPARTAGELLAAARAPLLQALSTEADGTRPPLFAYLHFMDPHGPYDAHAYLERELSTDSVDISGARALYAGAGLSTPARAQAIDANWDGIAEEVSRYDQEVRHTDEHIGLLLDVLRENGSLENTIVAVVADHGEGLWDHLAAPELREEGGMPRRTMQHDHGKQLYSELIGTPLILWGPGVPRGVRHADPVENIDLFPTLLELAGLPPLASLHGRSLLPALTGSDVAPKNVFSRIREVHSVREGGSPWKLMRPTELGLAKGREVRLYNVQEDPRELRNRAAGEPEVVARLSRLLDEWVLRHPTPTSIGRKKSQGTLDDLHELGYGGHDE